MADRIENRAQLEQLHSRYDQAQGALAAARSVQEHAESMVVSYLETVGVIIGVTLQQGDRVTINWQTGEVDIESTRQMPTIDLDALNGVPSA
ncbi:MAG TPA: hypothetical protein VFB50_00240 [Chloroflexota bacterium]|nr:hypothetical protein [Chloroflexota bacterium]